MFQRAFFLPILPDLMIWSNYFVLPGVLFLVCMFWDWVVQRHRQIVQQWKAKNEGSLLVPGEEIVRLMRDWLENVLITEPTMRKMIFQSKCLVRRGWSRCQTAKPEKPQELPPLERNGDKTCHIMGFWTKLTLQKPLEIFGKLCYKLFLMVFKKSQNL